MDGEAQEKIRIILPPAWRNGPPAPPASIHRSVPDGYYVAQWIVQDTYWDVLAFRHDGMEAEAQVAEQRCSLAADQLRAAFTREKWLGPDFDQAADAAIAWAVKHAEQLFAANLSGSPYAEDWRARRGKPRGYF